VILERRWILAIIAVGAFVAPVSASTLVVDSTLTAWPKAALQAKSSGVAQIVVKGDCRKLGVFTPLEPVDLVGDDGMIAGVQLFDYAPHATGGSRISRLEIDGAIDCRASDVTIEHCHWRDWRAQCIRIRQSASRCVIRRCTMIRIPPFGAKGDVVAIQFSDGETLDNKVLECTILNYTDAIQTTDRANPDGSSNEYGYCAGLAIRGNTLGFTGDVRSGLENIEGCENALDFKTGGTPDNPVIVEGNFLLGVRPNSRNPKGYAITYHRCASDLLIKDNSFIDCGSAIGNHIQYVDCVNGKGVFNPRVTVIENTLTQTPRLLVGPGRVSRKLPVNPAQKPTP
jgi:hypothetical protein